MWVPLIENNEFNSKGGEYFIKKYKSNELSVPPLKLIPKGPLNIFKLISPSIDSV